MDEPCLLRDWIKITKDEMAQVANASVRRSSSVSFSS